MVDSTQTQEKIQVRDVLRAKVLYVSLLDYSKGVGLPRRPCRCLWAGGVVEGRVEDQRRAQVSTHVALDHQTYSALAQHTQITWTAVLKCDEPSRVGRGRLGYITYQFNVQICTTRPASYKKSKH